MEKGTDWNLAQLNIAKMMYGADDPEMQDFNAALDTVNAYADASPGFAWRLVSDGEEFPDDLVFNDPAWLVNMSVWADLDALLFFIRSDLHLSIMKRRSEWFQSINEATMVLWWVPEGHVPTVAEAQERLEALRKNGPSANAFGFATTFPAPRA
jgi:hypothetical protein